ncbi:MAG: HlyD family type I secretion periplasmic adaptor subunit, partial [Bdellovibrionales bacterium]|nr:HlyD family type I secretion periplasmic adaptor subunit [Bdellovibrionales bacterium]
QQKEIIISSKMAKNEEEEVLRKQIDQKKGILSTLLKQKITAEKNVSIARESYLLEKEAYDSGIGTKTSYLAAKSSFNREKGSLEQIKAQIMTARDQIKEFESRFASIEFSSNDKVQQELAEIKNEITENNGVIENLKKRVEKLIVKSPVNGIVKGLEYTTIGAVIPPGAKVMEIVPTDQELIAEVKIYPHDVGHVKIGDLVNIKVTSFDFSRYGTLEGVLRSVSATTFSSERGETYYKANISLSKNYVGNNPKKNIILPGMEILGDIVTGDKTVMQFLLKPVHTSLQGAFSER